MAENNNQNEYEKMSYEEIILQICEKSPLSIDEIRHSLITKYKVEESFSFAFSLINHLIYHKKIRKISGKIDLYEK